MKKWIPALVLVAVVAIWLGYLMLVKSYRGWIGGSDEWPGTFGDSFGALNTLFTGLAFAGLVISILQQSAELKLQRDELTHQREALEAQGKELAAQAAAMRRSAEAQERTAHAQERAANAQSRSALLVAKTELLRSYETEMEAGRGGTMTENWLRRQKDLLEKCQKLKDEISAIGDRVE